MAEYGYRPEDGCLLGLEEPLDDAAIGRTLGRGKAVAFTVRVQQVNRSTGERGLLTDHGLKPAPPAGGPNLDRLRVGERYRFECAEATELDPLRRDLKALYLQNIGPA